MPLIQIDLDRDLFDALGDAARAPRCTRRRSTPWASRPTTCSRSSSRTAPGELQFDPGYNGVDRQQPGADPGHRWCTCTASPPSRRFFEAVVDAARPRSASGREDVLICRRRERLRGLVRGQALSRPAHGPTPTTPRTALMLQHDGAALRVLYLGGTGTISASCVRLSVESGMDVSVLNRGHNAAARDLPDGVTWLTGDVADDASLRGRARRPHVRRGRQLPLLRRRRRRADGGPVRRRAPGSTCTSARARSTPSRCWQTPITESTPIGPNPRPRLRHREVARRGRAAAGPRRDRLPGDDRAALAHLRRREPAAARRLDRGRPDRPRRRDPGARRRHVAVDADPRGGLRRRAWSACSATRGRSARSFNITGDDVLHLGPDLHDRRRGARRRARSSCTSPPSCSRWSRPTGSGPARWSATSGTAPSSTPPRSAASCPASRPGSPSTAPRTGWSRGGRRTRRRPAPTRTTEAVLDRIVGAYHAGRAAFAERAPQPRRRSRDRAAPRPPPARADRARRSAPLCVGTSPLASMPRPLRLRGRRGAGGRDRRGGLRQPDQLHRHLERLRRGRHRRAPDRPRDPPRPAACPPALVLATKVDPDPRTGDFSGDRVRASLEECLERLGVDRVPLLHLHDPERITFEEATAPGGAGRGAGRPARARASSTTSASPAARSALLQPLPRHRRVRGRAEPQPLHAARPVGRGAVRRGAPSAGSACSTRRPYGGGMLAKGPDVQPKYAYGTRGDARRRRPRRDAGRPARGTASRSPRPRCSSRCARRWSTRPSSASPRPSGSRRPCALAAVAVPDALWAELEQLVPDRAGWLG